ncbi:hypothetical protein F5B22DRAFT_109548 [Xylaria bambusicola]|uniref:uncharacterized protein n=1 Tax=Xylaria bambusicola TaxID=326684 RepID=UPI0020081D92|nr:uncharacterized protein F5B22DRAFT_109548 [Xylaria bambusicola]KAI0517545.1 hypothetical protein F5B22DRAFT_109548 [Xylaria bambusicola]
MAPSTILNSLSEPLPRYPADGLDALPDIQPSGSSTKETNPPKFWVMGRDWAASGVNAITASRRRLVAAGLETEFIYKKETAIKLLTEGDVTRAAALYLLHPVNQALSALNPDISCLSEHHGNTIRSDVTYKFGLDRAFAIVEFKKRGVIRMEEFRGALLELNNDRARAQAQINDKIMSAMDERGMSFFRKNSLNLLKQAANYAVKHGTNYVAMFDWNYLILITFNFDTSPPVEDREINGAGDYCSIRVIEENSPGMRKALFAFLCAAAGLITH